MKQRDNQRSRVYQWEREVVFCDPRNRTLTLDDCRELACKVFERWGRAHPLIQPGRGHRRATWSFSWPRALNPQRKVYSGMMQLPRWARQSAVILHESAHGLAPEGEQHGKVFVRWYVDLLAEYMLMSPLALAMSAVDHGIEVNGWKNAYLN